MDHADWKKALKKMPEALCLWGEVEDVCLLLKGHPVVLHEKPEKLVGENLYVCQGSMEFTAKQALRVGFSLIDAACKAMELEHGLLKADVDKARQDVLAIQHAAKRTPGGL